MKITQIQKLLSAEVLCNPKGAATEVHSACGSDMMSDVLAYVKNQAVLLTGLVNPQVLHTMEMMDMKCVVFVRNKKPTEAMLALAEELGIVVLTTEKRLFEACGILYVNGLSGSGDHE